MNDIRYLRPNSNNFKDTPTSNFLETLMKNVKLELVFYADIYLKESLYSGGW